MGCRIGPLRGSLLARANASEAGWQAWLSAAWQVPVTLRRYIHPHNLTAAECIDYLLTSRVSFQRLQNKQWGDIQPIESVRVLTGQ